MRSRASATVDSGLAEDARASSHAPDAPSSPDAAAADAPAEARRRLPSRDRLLAAVRRILGQLSLRDRIYYVGCLIALTLVLMVTEIQSQIEIGMAERTARRDLAWALEDLNGALRYAPDRGLFVDDAALPARLKRPDGLSWRVESAAGELLYGPAGAAGPPPVPLDPVGINMRRDLDMKVAGVRWLVTEQSAAHPGGRGVLRLTAARPRADAVALLLENKWALAGLAAAVGFTLAGGAALHAWWALRPFRRLRLALALARDGRTDTIDGAYPQEIQLFVDVINVLLRRDNHRVVWERNQALNLSHGMTTPLTVLLNYADRIAALDRKLAADVRMELERMQRQLDHHLARLRAAGPRVLSGPAAQVAPALAALLQLMEHRHAQRGVVFTTDVEPGACFSGDPHDLEEMLGCLLDHAGQWAATRVAVTVAFENDDDDVTIVVEDDGPGPPRSLRAQMRAAAADDPARRAADERNAGGGLAFALMRELAMLYEGKFRFEAVEPIGLRAVLTLPAGR